MPRFEISTHRTVELRSIQEAVALFRQGWCENPCSSESSVSLLEVLHFQQSVAKAMLATSGRKFLTDFVAALARDDFEAARAVVTEVAQQQGATCAAFFAERDPGWTWRFEFFTDCWPVPDEKT